MGKQSRSTKRIPGLDRIEIQFTKDSKTKAKDVGRPPSVSKMPDGSPNRIWCQGFLASQP